MLRPAVSRVCRTAISVTTPRIVSMSETGQVAPSLQPTVAAATNGVSPPPIAAPTWKPSEIPL
jgi:hypothetical protein